MNKKHADQPDQWRRRLVELLDAVAAHEGAHPTSIEGVEVWRASAPIPRHPVVYQPKIVVIGQGHKRGYLGDQTYLYDPQNYLVLTVPLPFECETLATPDKPLLGISVTLDPTMLGEMLLEMDDAAPPDEEIPSPRGIFSTPLGAGLSDVVIRLLECLRSPLDSRVLGRQLVRELVYRVVRGEQGGALRALASRNDAFARIARVLRWVHAEYDQPLTTEGLARRAGMSVSVFHHSFKQVTATSPLRYVKQVKLHRARALMAHDGFNAGAAASKVGYESASQFGREFKRLFGVPPVQAASKLRRQLVTVEAS